MSGGRLLIVGSGRSGSGWVARLLRAAGLRCGHEQVFTPQTAFGGRAPVWGRWEADASWLAVPRLPQLTPTVAVVRHPLPVAASLTRIGQFAAGRDSDPYTRVWYRWRPGIREEQTVQDRALAAWRHTTATATMYADLTIRVEHLDAAAPATLLDMAGGDPSRAVAAFAAVPDTDQTKNRKTGQKTVPYVGGWHQHRPGLADSARALAEHLGYTPDAP